MKDLKRLFFLMLGMTISLCATSCLSDDDDKPATVNPLTQAEKVQQLQQMGGFYNGFYFFRNDSTGTTDSIPARWEIIPSDSTLRVLDFPVKTLSYGVYNNEDRQILLAGGTQPLQTTLHPYANAYNKDGYYTYWIIPQDHKLEFTTEYGGKAYPVKVEFTEQMTAYTNSGIASPYYAYGEYLKQKVMAFILIKSVTVGDKSYTTGRATFIYGYNATVPFGMKEQ